MYIRLSLAVLVVFLCTHCGKQSAESELGKEDSKVIYTTNYPLFFITKQLAPASVSVRFPATEATDPSLWKPLADTIAAMQQADLVFINGASYEKWLSMVSLPESKLVNTAAGFKDRLIYMQETTTHSHGADGTHAHQGTAITSWMDLTLAIEQTKAVEQALVGLLPNEATFIQAQSTELQSTLADLHQQFIQAAEEFSASVGPVVFSHPVYQYFQRAYGITGPSLHLEPDEPISEQQLNELIELQRQSPLAVCIWEDTPLASSVTALEELGITSVVVDPMGNRPQQGDFLDGLKNNLAQLHTLK